MLKVRFGFLYCKTITRRTTTSDGYKLIRFPTETLRISEFKFPPTMGVHLPRVEVMDYDFGPELIPYDPSYVDFPPPPKIPESDGYKTQFVCDYDYDPYNDPGKMYHDHCFHYVYTPMKKIKNSVGYPSGLNHWGHNVAIGGAWWWRDEANDEVIFNEHRTCYVEYDNLDIFA